MHGCKSMAAYDGVDGHRPQRSRIRIDLGAIELTDKIQPLAAMTILTTFEATS